MLWHFSCCQVLNRFGASQGKVFVELLSRSDCKRANASHASVLLSMFMICDRGIVTKQILKADYNFDEEVWNDRSAEGKAFVSSLLQIDQKKRPSAEQALKHPWLHSETSLSDRTPDLEAMKSAQARLVQYAESGDFRKLVMQVIAKRATAEEILNLREIFNKFDSNHDGTITFEEFKHALAQSGFSDEVIQSIFRKLVRRSV